MNQPVKICVVTADIYWLNSVAYAKILLSEFFQSMVDGVLGLRGLHAQFPVVGAFVRDLVSAIVQNLSIVERPVQAMSFNVICAINRIVQ